MADHLPLLIELGTEELPPKALPELAQAFHDGVLKALAARRIDVRTEASDLRAGPLYSPRRLAVFLPAVAVQQPQQHSEVLGPYMNIGLDADGKPTPALLGFAQKNGLPWEKLDRVTDAKGMRFAARSSRPGAATIDLLAEITAEALRGLPIPKPMRWGSRDIAFVRPVHWLVILLGRDVAPGEVLGLKADRTASTTARACGSTTPPNTCRRCAKRTCWPTRASAASACAPRSPPPRARPAARPACRPSCSRK